MLVRNWYKYFSILVSGVSNGSIIAPLKTEDGTESNAYVNSEEANGAWVRLTLHYMNKFRGTSNDGVAFGTGTTEPTIDDYCLESLLDSSAISVTTTSSINNNDGIRIYTYNIKNLTEEAITITEYGLFNSVKFNGFNGLPYLFTHALLDIPVTIQPGETGVVIIKETISALSQ